MNYAPPPKPKPHGAMYLVPLAVWILFSIGALVVAGVGAVSGLSDRVDELERVSATTGGEVDLEEGSTTIYYEELTGSDVLVPPNIGVEVLDPAGEPIPVSSGGSSSNYSTGSRSGISIGSFDAEQTGTYTILVSGEGTASGELAIGDDVLLGVAKSSAMPLLVIGTVGFLIALAIAIVIARKRGNSKRQIQQAYSGGGGYGPPGGYGGPGVQGPGYGAPGSYPPAGGYGAPGSYPPPGGSMPGYQQPPGNDPPPSPPPRP